MTSIMEEQEVNQALMGVVWKALFKSYPLIDDMQEWNDITYAMARISHQLELSELDNYQVAIDLDEKYEEI
mgnify:FL=1|tara:strand:+ start:188 stop:400 length:213 start_codon:yes stop_codon:yes gene_type:complete